MNAGRNGDYIWQKWFELNFKTFRAEIYPFRIPFQNPITFFTSLLM